MAKPVNIQANLQLNPASINSSAKQVQQALGRITGQASEFQKSLDASTARVFAFGATTAVINGVTQSFKALVSTTVNVQAKLIEINSILGAGQKEFNNYRNAIFQVAKTTGQSFNTVADGAAELARQGLSATESAKRLEAALILTRISGLGSAQSVKALTAAMNGFTSAGLTAEQVVNKIVAVDTAFAVSAQDLAEGFSRAGSTAEDAGVKFDELLALITAVEQRTARGGAVIGNAFKSIFTRLSRGGTIGQLQELGVAIDANQTGVQKLKALSDALEQVSDPTIASQIKELAGGVFQINVVSAALKDIGSEASIFGKAAKTSFEATNEATQKNAALNDSLLAQFNSLIASVTSFGQKLGELTIAPALENIIGVAGKIAEAIDSALDPESGNKFIQGILKAIGSFVSGPGLVIFGAAFLKIFKTVFKFAKEGFKNIMQIGSAAEELKTIEAGIVDLLGKDEKLRKKLVDQTISQADKEQAVIDAIERENTLLRTQKSLLEQAAKAAQKRGVGSYDPSEGFRPRRKRRRYAAGGSGQMEPDLMTALANEARDAPAGAVPYVTNFRGQPAVMNTSEAQVRINGREEILRQDQIPRFANRTRRGVVASNPKAAATGDAPQPLQNVNTSGTYVMIHGERGSKTSEDVYYDPTFSKKKRYRLTKTDGATKVIKVPIYPFPHDKEDAQDINQFTVSLEDYARQQALGLAQGITGNQMPKPKRNAINAKINDGALQGFAGSIYELSLATLLTDDEFAKYETNTQNSNFDLSLDGQTRLKKLFDINKKVKFGEVKNRLNDDNLKSAAAKINRVTGGETGKKQKAQKNKFVGNYVTAAQARDMGIDPGKSKRYLIQDKDLDKASKYFGNDSQVSDVNGKKFIKFKRGRGGLGGLRNRSFAKGSRPNLKRSQISSPRIKRFASGSYEGSGGVNLQVDSMSVDSLNANKSFTSQFIDTTKQNLSQVTSGQGLADAAFNTLYYGAGFALVGKFSGLFDKLKPPIKDLAKGAKDLALAKVKSSPKFGQVGNIASGLGLSVIGVGAGMLANNIRDNNGGADTTGSIMADVTKRSITGATLGGTLGSIVLPGPGTAIGAVVGAVVGGVGEFLYKLVDAQGQAGKANRISQEMTMRKLDETYLKRQVNAMTEGLGLNVNDKTLNDTVVYMQDLARTTQNEFGPALLKATAELVDTANALNGLGESDKGSQEAVNRFKTALENVKKIEQMANKMEAISLSQREIQDEFYDLVISGTLGKRASQKGLIPEAISSALDNPIFREGGIMKQLGGLSGIKGVTPAAQVQDFINTLDANLLESTLKKRQFEDARSNSRMITGADRQASILNAYGFEMKDEDQGSYAQAVQRGFGEAIEKEGKNFTKILKDGALELGKQQVEFAKAAAAYRESGVQQQKVVDASIVKDVISANTDPKISSERVDAIIRQLKDATRSGDEVAFSNAFSNLQDETRGLIDGKELEFLRNFRFDQNNPMVRKMLDQVVNSNVSGKGFSAGALRSYLSSNYAVSGEGGTNELAKKEKEAQAASDAAEKKLADLRKKAKLPDTQNFIDAVQNVANKLSSIIGDVKKAEQIGAELERTNRTINAMVSEVNDQLEIQYNEIKFLKEQYIKNAKEAKQINNQLSGKPSGTNQ